MKRLAYLIASVLLGSCSAHEPSSPPSTVLLLPMPVTLAKAIPPDVSPEDVYSDGTCWFYRIGKNDYPITDAEGYHLCGNHAAERRDVQASRGTKEILILPPDACEACFIQNQPAAETLTLPQ